MFRNFDISFTGSLCFTHTRGDVSRNHQPSGQPGTGGIMEEEIIQTAMNWPQAFSNVGISFAVAGGLVGLFYVIIKYSKDL
jgi:hypothetical protein